MSAAIPPVKLGRVTVVPLPAASRERATGEGGDVGNDGAVIFAIAGREFFAVNAAGRAIVEAVSLAENAAQLSTGSTAVAHFFRLCVGAGIFEVVGEGAECAAPAEVPVFTDLDAEWDTGRPLLGKLSHDMAHVMQTAFDPSTPPAWRHSE